VRNAAPRPPANGADESKVIETHAAGTNVPNSKVIVAEALAALRIATIAQGDTRMKPRPLSSRELTSADLRRQTNYSVQIADEY